MRFSTLDQWLTWQESLHPSEIDLGLDRVQQVLQRMQLGRRNFTVISVAGTNGKGSCVAMLDAIYRAAGYNVGSYMSPHIKYYTERIMINGRPVSEDALCRMFQRVDEARRDISLTYFEFGTLAAIGLFYQAQLDVAILEVGLGGRLDAVNILDAELAIISSVGLDHQAWLGDTRESIALEKAGIARPHRPVVCGDPDPPAALLAYLEDLQAPLYLINRDFHYQVSDNTPGWTWHSAQCRRVALPVPALRGVSQLLNAASVLMAVELLAQALPVNQAPIREGLTSVTLAGRFQVLQDKVTLIVDVAHNPQSAQALASTLRQWPCPGKTHAVFAVLKDKDVSGILQAMADSVDCWHIAQLDAPRAMPAGEIFDRLRSLSGDIPAFIYPSVETAKQAALAQCAPQDRVVVFGSFLVASEVL